MRAVVAESRLFPELPNGLDACIVVYQSSAKSVVATKEEAIDLLQWVLRAKFFTNFRDRGVRGTQAVAPVLVGKNLSDGAKVGQYVPISIFHSFLEAGEGEA
jgi:hypothetical protein